MTTPLHHTSLTSVVAKKYPMVKLVTYIVGLFDPYGIDHSERVAILCMRIGERMSMSGQDLEDLEMGALLHDIGKLGVPESIRSKPGALTSAEYFLMQQHPIIGKKIIEQMNGSLSVKVHEVVLYHHEDYGGTGYPDRLKGGAIPINARIARIADTYDAITHTRGYRAPVEKRAAIAIMKKDQEALKLFDPQLFRLFLEIMKDKKR